MTGRVEQLRLAARLRRVLAERRRYDALPEAGRAAWRDARLTALRDHAVRRSPRYAELHRGHERAPLDALPTLTKADLVARFDELVTDRRLTARHLRAVVAGHGADRALGRYRVGCSSGSTGRPGLLPFDEGEWVGLIANAARARALAGRPAVEGRVRSAKVGSPSPWHLSRQVAGTLSDPRKPSLALDAAAGTDSIADELGRWQPHVLSGYPSVLAALAHEQRERRLSIDPVQVFGGGEPLSAGARQQISAAWGCEPFDQYATTEAGFVAAECRAHDGLHVLDDHVLVEVVDASGAPVPAGAHGARLLVTVLGSRTLPLIRYELDDVVALADGACACGRGGPRLTGIAGRERELLRLPAVAGGAAVVHPVAVTSVLDVAPVRGWQVVQEQARLVVRVVGPSTGFAAGDVVDRLGAVLGAAGAVVPVIEVDVVGSLDRGPSGKASLVVVDRATRDLRPG